MTRFSFHLNTSVPRTIAAAAAFIAIAMASPSQAAGGDLLQGTTMIPVPTMLADATPMQAAPTEKKKMSNPMSPNKNSGETIESHIKNLHDKLQITAAQESKWNDVAQVMRDNADRLAALAKARSENAKTMTAVDDLKSYAEIAKAHEEGIEKLLPAFITLYDSMSDAQKKAADADFRERHEHHHRGHQPS